jgi:Fur family ferric uptake transcriptional regulator
LGRATVYRTLKLLTGANIASSVSFGTGANKFECTLDHSHHDHLICTQCGAVIEFYNPVIEKMQEKVAKKHGFVFEKHRLDIFGLCKKCRKTRKGE